jgi:hypothetical protein
LGVDCKLGSSAPSVNGLPPSNTRKDLLRCGYGKCEDNLGQAILVFGVGVLDVGFGFLEFGLGKFDDGAETKVVAGLRKVEREAGLFAELLGDGKSFKSAAGVLPGVANVTGDVVAGVEQLLAIGFGLEVGGFGARVVEESVENRDVDVDADGPIPVLNMVVADGSFSDNTEGVHRRPDEIVLGAAEFLRGLDFELQSFELGPLLESLLN